jgi:membrane protease YdiL (CAAX protease family)
VTFVLALVLLSTLSIFGLKRAVDRRSFSVGGSLFIGRQVAFQVLQLSMAAAVAALAALLHPENARRFFSVGRWDAPAGAVPWLGIGPGETWRGLGVGLGTAVTLGTGLFLYFQFRRSAGVRRPQPPLLLWVVLFAATNALAEELIYRWGVVVPLAGTMSSAGVLALSAVLFGLPHIGGTPGGPIGALMAGFLGWILAKSMLETQGLFWAWSLHFVQDVLIFYALLHNPSPGSVPST